MRRPCLLVMACSLSCGTPQAQDSVHVVSFNLRWDAPNDGPNRWQYRRHAVADYLSQAPRPLGALQELTPAQLEDLQAQVHADYLWSQQAHVTALIPPGYEAQRTQVIDLPGSGFARAATMVELSKGQRRMTFVSVHLSGGPDGLLQTERLLQALNGWPRPWIMAGDFNAYAMPTRDCLRLGPEYHVLCNGTYERLIGAGFVDPVVALHGVVPHSTATGFQPPSERWQPNFDARIDWVLATPGLVPERAWIADPMTAAGRPLSDHRPVHVQLRFGDVAEPSPGPQRPQRVARPQQY